MEVLYKIWRNLNENRHAFNRATEEALNLNLVVLDTETTGLSKDAEAVQITLIRVGYRNGRYYIIEILDMYIKPSKHVPKEASDVHHITDEMLADKPTAQEAFPRIKAFLGDSPAVCAYNLPFDMRILSHFYEMNGETFTPCFQLDLLKVAKDCLCEQQMKDHKLATVCNYYGVDEDVKGYHSALEDTKVLVKLMNALVKDIQENAVDKADAPKKALKLWKLNYWPGFRGNSRLYAVTSGGSLYWDMKKDTWESPTLDLSEVNMTDLETQVFELASSMPEWQSGVNAHDYKELSRLCRLGVFTENKQ